MNENIQYWINQDGVQAGPVTREQLKDMAVTDAAYVWRAGMEDWCRITEMPELAGLYSTAPADEAQQPQAEAPPQAQTDDEVVTGTPVIPPIPQQPAARVQPQMQPQPQMAAQQVTEQPKCPPTNLVWAILSTILCCLPLGVVAIVYSTKVTQKYQQGDLAAAEHYSEVSAWWCIGSIIGGIVLSPFVSLIQMAMMQ